MESLIHRTMPLVWRNKLVQLRSRSFRKIYLIVIALILSALAALHLSGTDRPIPEVETITEEAKTLYKIGRSELGQVASVFFLGYRVVHMDSIAYDIYSIRELGQLSAAPQWHNFPLPGEKTSVKPWMPALQPSRTFPVVPSPKTRSTLAYVDDVYVVTDPAFDDRIKSIERMFRRHDLPAEAIQWRMGPKNRSKCDGNIREGEHHWILNLSPGPIGNPTQQRYCYVTMLHIQIWQQVAGSKSPLSLILEDDAVFVPFFKEKFDRFVYTAMRTGALQINRTECATPRQNLSANEWINQDPVFEVGACANLRDASFPPENGTAAPMLSAHKERCSRCSHAYVLTPCSAQALLRQMFSKKTGFQVIDWLQSYLGQVSPTLQPFWLDPGIAYQGSQAHDLNRIPTFGRSMTQENE